MDIRQGENKFYIGESAENPDAEITFVPTGEKRIIVDHTHVGDALRGQGVGEKLVAAALEYARGENLLIVPLCPFTKNQFEKHSEYEDVWAK